MAYSSGAGGVTYKHRLNYYSNPGVRWEGSDTGTVGEDNARVITQNRSGERGEL